MSGRAPADGTRRARRRASAKSGDLELWRAATREVTPLRGRAGVRAVIEPPPPEAAEPAPAPKPRHGPSKAPKPRAELPLIGGHHPPGLDRSSAERLKRGKYKIEARIDLHGMTQDRAHRALTDFVARAAQDGLRCVLVITGKGLRKLAGDESGRVRPDDLGILRNAVPRWLNEPPTRARILAFGTAQERDGGSGALYVLLRRWR
jgi:DNA-nicking Smr family endonuclease